MAQVPGSKVYRSSAASHQTPTKQPSSKIDVGWHNAEKLRQLMQLTRAHPEDIHGVRVVYFNNHRDLLGQHSDSEPLGCDHPNEHNEHWTEAISAGGLEAGTITRLSVGDDTVPTVTVTWDCGAMNTYTCDQDAEWKYLRAYSLGPAGYLGQMVFCDKCLLPSKGLAFRLARQNVRFGDLYDLCYKCYNKCDDEHVGSGFHCNVPSGDIDLEADKVSLPPRKKAHMYEVMGIFKKARVVMESSAESSEADNKQTIHGEVLNIVHEKGNYDLRKAKYYDSCAEVKLATGSSKTPLVYKEAGSAGKVELKAIDPGAAKMPVEHYPVLGTDFIREIQMYNEKLVKMDEKDQDECYCFIRFKNSKGYSLTISGTRLTQITNNSIWEKCENLKVVTLLMNELESLPDQLESFSDTIKLVCVQHNNFTEVPNVLFKLTRIEHLNLHGNQISKFPREMRVLVKLERLKFGHNRLYSLPNIFSSFQNLTEITFNDNFLTRLPPSFTELAQLEKIDLTDNSFTSIPAPLLKLPKLKVLHLKWNRIHKLAPIEDYQGRATFSLIKQLVSLKLKGNPVREQLDPALDNHSFLDCLQDWNIFSELHKAPLSKALRVLVLGCCGSGKTSIVRALTFKKYVTPTSEAHHDHTVGIDRYAIPVRMKNNGKNVVVELRLWDFAGERSYIMMNSLFLTEGTLVWIAVNFQTYKCTEVSFHQNVSCWLQQVMTKSAKPVVWVIGTHTDKCTAEEVDEKSKHIFSSIRRECNLFEDRLATELGNLHQEKDRSRSPACIRKNFEELLKLKKSNVPCFVAQNLKVIYLTNTRSFAGFSELKNSLEQFLQNDSFSHLAKPLSISQVKAADKLRQRTEEMLSDGEPPILEKAKVVSILSQELDESYEAKSFLQYLSQTGEVLDCQLHPDIILDVDWLINLLKCVFYHDFATMVNEKKKSVAFYGLSNENLQKAIATQQKTGIVEHALLEALWSPLRGKMFTYVVRLLETFGLAYKTTDYPSGYLFPWLVKTEYSDPIPPKVSDQRSRILVSYDFSPCLPICFIQQLAVKCKEHFSIRAVYKNAFIVNASRDDATVLTARVSILHEENSMCGKVSLFVAPQEDIASDTVLETLWSVVMTIIRRMEALLSYWPFYSNLKRKVYCPICFSHFWDLSILDSEQKKGQFKPVFYCDDCNKTILWRYVHPPPELLLNMYVDHPMPLQYKRSASIPTQAPCHNASAPAMQGYLPNVYSCPVLYNQPPQQFDQALPGWYSFPRQPPMYTHPQHAHLPLGDPSPHPQAQYHQAQGFSSPYQSGFPSLQAHHSFSPTNAPRMQLSPNADSSHYRPPIQEEASPPTSMQPVAETLSGSQLPIQEEADGHFADEMETDAEMSTSKQIQSSPDFPSFSDTTLQHRGPTLDPNTRHGAIAGPTMPKQSFSNSVQRAQLCNRPLTQKDHLLLARKSSEHDWQGLMRLLGLSQENEDRIFCRADDLSGEPPLLTELIYEVLLEWMNVQKDEATVAALANAIVQGRREADWKEAFCVCMSSEFQV